MSEYGIVQGYLAPHPPNLLEADASGENLETIEALREAGNRIREADVDIVLVASAHWQPVGPFFIDASPRHKHVTDYFGFSVEVTYECSGDPDLAKKLMDAGSAAGLLVDCVWGRGMDHGVTVPLHFMLPDAELPVLPLSVSVRPMEECRRWGELIAETCTREKRRAALIASSAISHHLPLLAQPEAPSRYHDFETLVIQALDAASPAKLLEIDSMMVEEAEPEGGLRDVMTLLAAVGDEARGQLLSYESFYGIGFATFQLDRSR